MRKERKKRDKDEIGRNEMVLFSDNMIVHIDNLEKSTKKVL